MGAKLLGIPLVFWATACLILALVWLIFWPSDKAVAVTGMRWLILRWFHALVWLLVAIAALLAAFNIAGGVASARIVALLALLTYLVFLFTLTTTRS